MAEPLRPVRGRWTIVALIAGMAIGGCAHRPAAQDASATIALDRLLAFDAPATCTPAKSHEQLLAALVGGDANEGFRAGTVLAPADFAPAFGRVVVRRHDHYWTVGVPISGSLFGVPLVKIVHALPEGGDAGDITYVFRAAPARMETILRQRGFPVRAGLDVPVGPPDGLQFGIGLRRDPANRQQTLLTCGVL